MNQSMALSVTNDECLMSSLESKKGGKDQELIQSSTQDTTWESDKGSIKHTNKSEEVSLFSAGDHKATMNRRESMTNTRHK